VVNQILPISDLVSACNDRFFDLLNRLLDQPLESDSFSPFVEADHILTQNKHLLEKQNPALWVWFHTVRQLIKANQNQIPIPNWSVIHYLDLDDNAPERIGELMDYKLVESLLTLAIDLNKSLDIQLSTSPPTRFHISFLGLVDLTNYKGNFRLIYDDEGQLEIQISNKTVFRANFFPHLQIDLGQTIAFSFICQTSAGNVNIPTADPMLYSSYLSDAPVITGNSVEKIKDWCQKLHLSQQILAAVIGDFNQIFQLTHTVLPAYSYLGQEGVETISSSSPEEAIGLSYLPYISSIVSLAECWLHEAMHQYLYQLEFLSPLLRPDIPETEKFYSPWRTDPRPISGVLHGAFVFTEVASFYQILVQKKNRFIESKEAALNAFFRAYQVHDALKVLEVNAQFTETGKTVFLDRLELIQSILTNLPLSSEEKSNIQHSVEKNRNNYPDYLAW